MKGDPQTTAGDEEMVISKAAGKRLSDFLTLENAWASVSISRQSNGWLVGGTDGDMTTHKNGQNAMDRAMRILAEFQAGRCD